MIMLAPIRDSLTHMFTTGYGTINMVEGFGFGDYSPAFAYLLHWSFI